MSLITRVRIHRGFVTACIGPVDAAIGTVDYYGIRKVSKIETENALQIHQGAKVSKSLLAAQKRLESVRGVAHAKLNFVCCDPAVKTILYVGIQEVGTPVLRFRPAPNANVRLTPAMVRAVRAFYDALFKAVKSGHGARTIHRDIR